MRCVGVVGGLGGQVNVSYQSKSDRNHDTGKPSLTAEFNPTNPLEQGLGDRFFCPTRYISDMSVECQYCVAICRAATEISQTTTIMQKRSLIFTSPGPIDSDHRYIEPQANLLAGAASFCTTR